MMLVIPKFLLFVVMTTAADVTVPADSSSSSSLATNLAIEEETSSKNEERATTTTTTTTIPEGFAAPSSPSASVEVSGVDGNDISAPRKLSKSSKKVQHPDEALCTLSLFADSVFMYANQCYDDIMVTISACDETDETCYISERLPSLPQEEEEEENQEEEQCFVGGSFPAKQNIRYNPSTGDCEFLYVDLLDDLCNLYTGNDGTGSLGLKARINVKNNLDVMFIQFTKDKGFTFYNVGDERVAKRSIDRFLRQDEGMKPVLSMMPHPFASRHRRMAPCMHDIGIGTLDVNDPPPPLNFDVDILPGGKPTFNADLNEWRCDGPCHRNKKIITNQDTFNI